MSILCTCKALASVRVYYVQHILVPFNVLHFNVRVGIPCDIVLFNVSTSLWTSANTEMLFYSDLD